jgi:adenylosuccinate synthase
MLHAMGREFGATTGRARRCGWFDAVATRHATMVNGIDELAVTNVDGLDSLDRVRVCVGYRAGRETFNHVPNDVELLARCEPIYVDFPGWKEATSRRRRWKDLPARCRAYLQAIAKFTGARLSLVSVGPAREETIIL